MALSGSVAVRATNQNNLIFSWGATQDIGANTSAIAWQLILEAGQYGRIDAGPGSPWTATVAGKTFSGTTDLSIGNNQTKVLSSGQVTVAHDAAGSASFSFSFTQEFWIQFGSEYISTVSGSGSAVLDTIGRISVPTLSAASLELGKTVSIYTNRASSALSHSIRWQFGSASGTIGGSVGDRVDWTPSLELARQIPNAVSGTAVIRCATYVGDTHIGTKEITLTLTVPASIVPTASASWEDLSGAYGMMDTLVQGVSKLRVDVTGTGSYGSAITGASVTLDGKPYSGGILTDAGAISLGITVSDSRGRTGSAAYTLSVAAYAIPSLTVSASRCLSDGTADEAGDHAKITVSGFVTQVNGKNRSELTVQWGSQSTLADTGVGNISWQKIVPADVNATMAVSAELCDRLVRVSRAMTLSTGYATLDFLAGGKGIAFGKAATREGFECAMPASFPGGIGAVKLTSADDLNNIRENGLYWWERGDTPANAPVASYGAAYYMNALRVWSANGNICCQEAMDVSDSSAHGTKIVRTLYGSAAYPWEWVNPPMMLGYEYRTTKRHNGKPVWATFQNCGPMPSSGDEIVYISALNIDDIVSFSAYMTNADHTDQYALPFGNLYYAAVRHDRVYKKTCESDISIYNCYVTLEYTKTTD